MFDKVIMNPPYNIGGKVWDETRKVSENIVCLMPLTQYKGNKRYKYIDYFEVIDNHTFDAFISGNLCITTCQPIDNKKSYEDFLFDSFNQKYRAFYEWNRRNDKGLEVCRKDNRPYTDFDIDLDFVIGSRAVDHPHCVSITRKGFDYFWNVLRRDYEDKWVNKIGTIHFFSKEARNNFTAFIYSKVGEPLMSKVLTGLNLIGYGYIVSYAIPQINWERISDHPLWKEERYDEAVLDTMGLRWEDNSKTKIIKKE